MSNYWITPSSTGATVSTDGSFIVTYNTNVSESVVEVKKEVKKEGISVKLYFNYVKSKLTKLQKEQLDNRIRKLYAMVEETKEIGQVGLMEDLARLLAIAIREQELIVLGYSMFVDTETINKFISKVKDKPIKFTLFDEFPRVIPEEVREQIKKVKSSKVFDTLHILYTDYTKEVRKSNEKKIIEKDPILFGAFAYQPGRYYYITSWIDDYCDLTLDTFIKQVGHPGSIPNIDDEYISKLKEFVLSKDEALKGTRRSNYEELAKKDKEATDKFINGKPVEKKKFWNKLASALFKRRK